MKTTQWLTRTLMILILASIARAQPARPAAPAAAQTAKPEKPLIQMAILLDTSNSMDGLINQARQQLWAIVNEYATARRHGLSPRLELALYEYGNNRLDAKTGYIRQALKLTDDLDSVSHALFELKTKGGKEFCGQVIQQAVKELAWSDNPNCYKVIFIAGNEPFTQGEVDYKVACRDAIQKGIMVNTIFCGNYDTGTRQMWADGAKLADGGYLNIDQNRKSIHIAAPQDPEIVQLGTELNHTYLAYGRAGISGMAFQSEQDKMALSVGGSSAVQRSVAKTAPQYSNSRWDLVDAVNNDEVKLESLPENEMPEPMKKMTPPQRKAYIKEMTEKRTELQEKIKQLNLARRKYIDAEMKKMAAKGEDTLEAVMIKLIRQQASKFNFEFVRPDSTGKTPSAPQTPETAPTDKP